MPKSSPEERKVEEDLERLRNQKLLDRLFDDCSTVGIGKRVIGGCASNIKKDD